MGSSDRLVTSSSHPFLPAGATAAIGASAALAALAAAIITTRHKDLLLSPTLLGSGSRSDRPSRPPKSIAGGGVSAASARVNLPQEPPLLDLLRFGAAAVEVSAGLTLVEVWRLRTLCRRSAELLRAKLVEEVETSPPREETGPYAMSAVLARSPNRTGSGSDPTSNEISDVALVFREALVTPDYLNQVDCAGRTPLMQASQQGAVRLCQALLAAKADVNQKGGNRWTALHYAVTSRSAATCNMLLDSGADLNARAADGRTALYYAFQAGDLQDITELLHRRGARPDRGSKNSSGEADAAYLRYLTREFFASDGTEEEFDRTVRMATVQGGRTSKLR